ncbi:MAG TPA: cell wall-binding repeat-containing protein, partial [Sandaracinaceae bacterium]
MRLALFAIALATVFGTAGCSCGSPSSLTVELATDLIAGGDYLTVETELSDAGGSSRGSARIQLGGGLVTATSPQPVAEFPGLAAGRYTILVRLLDPEGGALVVQRALVEVDGPTVRTIVVARACAGVACGAGETCAEGTCVPLECSLDREAAGCQRAPACAADDECGEVASACITPRCVLGACLEVPEHGRCAGELVCSADGECIEDEYIEVVGPEGPRGDGGHDDPDATFVDCPVSRIDLQGRFDVAATIAMERFHPDDVDEVIIARGDHPESASAQSPEALIAGPLARARDVPLLLVAPPVLTARTVEALEYLAPSRVTVVGVGDPLVDQRLREMGYAVTHVRGADRDDTAALVAREILLETGGTEAVIASGDLANLSDALVASAAAADLGAPLLFVGAGGVPARTAAALTDLEITSVWLVGGEGSVSVAVEDELRAITNTYRYGGADFASTAAVVAREIFVPPVTEAFLVRGSVPSDPSEAETYALGLTSLALPILFTIPSPPELGEPTRRYLSDGHAGSVT